MTDRETAWQAAESAASVLGPEADVLASVDSAGLGGSTAAVLRRAARNPGAMTSAVLKFWANVAMAGPVATARWLGVDAPPQVPVPEDDKRFADRTWSDNPAFFALRQGYLATSQLVTEVLAAGSGDAVDDAKARLAAGFMLDAKARLAAGFMLDAIAPTNFFFTNPAAIKRAMETGGASVAAGARNF